MARPLSIVGWLAAALTLVSCSLVYDSGRHKGASVEASAFCGALGEVACDGSIDCCGLGESSRGQCIALVSAKCALTYGPIFTDPRNGYDPAEAGRVLSEAAGKAQACDGSWWADVLSRDALFRIFKGTIPVGGDCSPASGEVVSPVACTGDSACLRTGVESYVCGARRSLGEECTAQTDCEATGFCALVTDDRAECTPLLADGEYCFDSAWCESFDCRGADISAAVPGVCTAPDFCTYPGSVVPCEVAAEATRRLCEGCSCSFDADTCEAIGRQSCQLLLLPPMADYERNGYDPRVGLEVLDELEIAADSCSPEFWRLLLGQPTRARLFPGTRPIGESCVPSGAEERGLAPYWCAESACVGEMLCSAQLGPGEACFNLGECGEGLACQLPTVPDASPACGPPVADGAACNYDEQCESKYCEPFDVSESPAGQCAPATACRYLE